MAECDVAKATCIGAFAGALVLKHCSQLSISVALVEGLNQGLQMSKAPGQEVIIGYRRHATIGAQKVYELFYGNACRTAGIKPCSVW
eukprot:CAMPEP_0185912110 /NCGR_PEP_ID=MMETSP0196C-20130402/36410_1 /TAXON_ID=2932 /ORGANISM="Alexandrium fundyense, Strain CCMP1719" /LENGTH=86 /DNA_ID=CAMNT_0028633287 /DNA_START=48 /DNA_END=305 /DNA_ORIENTATION=+